LIRETLGEHSSYVDLHCLLGVAELEEGHFDDAIATLAALRSSCIRTITSPASTWRERSRPPGISSRRRSRCAWSWNRTLRIPKPLNCPSVGSAGTGVGGDHGASRKAS
jgi:hypothetical protein